ncbi:MAG: DUF4340 domain-containing protein [Hyphomonadaceae bacterium]|nr:DUF4340 domain-containing protein [Clostridia bacterium]
MRKYRTAIWSAVALLALIGVWYWAEKTPEKQADKPKTEKISLFTPKSDDVTEVSITQPTGQLTFVKKDTKWQLKEQPHYPLDDSKVSSMVSTASLIEPTQKLEPSDLAQYGLNKPTYKFSVLLKDGKKSDFIVGDQTPLKGEYYMQMVGDNNIYTLGDYKVNELKNPLVSYHTPVKIEFTAEKVSEMKVEKDGKVLFAIVKNESGNKNIATKRMTTPYQKDVADQAFGEKVLKPLQELKPEEVVAEGGDLSAYGLSSSIYIKDEEGKEVKLWIGRDKDTSSYAKLGDSKTVFTVPKSALAFMSIDPFYLTSHFLALVNIENISGVTVQKGDSKFVLEVAKQGEQSTYKVNAKEAAADNFKKAYQEVLGLQADGYRKNNVSGNAEVTIQYTGLNEAGNVRIELMRADDRTYQVKLNGALTEDYILVSNVDNMFTKLAAFEKQPKAEK